MSDIPNNIGSTTTFVDTSASGVSVLSGTFETVGDKDWIRVQLNAGFTYNFWLEVTQIGVAAANGDGFLELFDVGGNPAAGTNTDDDSGGGFNSHLTYTPATTGTFYIQVSELQSDRGAWNLLFTTQAMSAFAGSSNDTVTGDLNHQGGQGNDSLVGGNTANFLSGGLGDDSLFGFEGNDELFGGAGNDLLDGGDHSDQLFGGDGLDNLNGAAGTDTLTGGGGDDALYGGTEADAFVMQRFGNDTVMDFVIADSDKIDLRALNIGSFDTWRLVSNGEAKFSVYLDGEEQNWITLDGVADNTLTAAQFILSTDTAADVIAGEQGADYLFGAGGADVFRGYGGDDWLFGEDGADILEGGEGDDILVGGIGADRMDGGTGNDTYSVDNAGDVVIEKAQSFFGGDVRFALLDGLTTQALGLDNVISSVSYTLGLNLEALFLTGNSALSGTGNAASNYIIGNLAGNILHGMGGNDLLLGEQEEGTAFGIDQMFGGDGSDFYFVQRASDLTIETNATAAGGIDTVVSNITRTLGANLENLILSDSFVINGTGNGLGNRLTGNDEINTLTGLGGNDVLDGMGLADIMVGGDGHDTYVVNVAGDVTTETNALPTGGIDTVLSLVTRTLGANLERLVLTGNAIIDGTGNGLANTLIGNTKANVLSGGALNDTLNGKLGNDTLNGGTQNDTFVFDTVLNSALNVDTIVGFVSNSGGQNDVIHLQNTGTGLFTMLPTGALNFLAFVGNAAGVATTIDHRIIYDTTDGRLLYDSNGTVGGSANAIHFATLAGAPGGVNFLDFVVI